MINRKIIFSYSKNEAIQFLPHFTIQLCPEEFPKPPTEYGHYAYFIDFQTEEVKNKKGILDHSYKLGQKPKIDNYQMFSIPDYIVQNVENSKVMNEILYLVNALNQNDFFQYGLRQHWTICLNDNNDFCYGQEGYRGPEYKTTIEEFNLIPNNEFLDPIVFKYTPTQGKEQPVRLGELFKQYFESANVDLKKKYLNACIVLTKSFRIHEIDWSASYLLMVSAIEALIEIEYEMEEQQICKCCGQPEFQVSKKFKSFIDKYGFEVDNKTKKLFYSLRSKIAHSGQLLGLSYDHKWTIETQEELDLEDKVSMDRKYFELFKHLARTCFRTFLFQNIKTLSNNV